MRGAALCLVLLIALACGGAGDGGDGGAGGGAGAADDAASEAAEAERLLAEAAERARLYVWPGGPHPTVTLHIKDYGTIVVELFPELANETVDNFLKLAASGYYAGTTFHRVIPEFMIQGGDPNSKDDNPDNDGQGGPDDKIPDEFHAAPHVRGVLAMANTGRPNSAGSQFFILQSDAPHLDGKYTIFGRVQAGMDVVDEIAGVETDQYGRWGAMNRPLDDVVIEKAVVDGAGGAAAQSSPREAAPAAEPDLAAR
jgi:peptidyl-prolyl cis-trans isomerase B (cyclophilin B)